MLKKLLHSVKKQKGSLSLVELSEEFNISIPLLEQMLMTLVRTGKLQEVQPLLAKTCTTCSDCPTNDGCDLSNIFQELQFQIIN